MQEILKKYWGYDSFRPCQEEIINAAVEREDVLAILPTGGGKSICFQIPALMSDGIAIVISPLISLIKDQVSNLRERGIKALAIHSGMTRREIDYALDNAKYGDYKFLYLSPERLQTEIFKVRLSQMNVSYIVVDEAHCISQWGYDFRPDYLHIAEIRDIVPDSSVIALTATATPEVAKDITEKLKFRKSRTILAPFERPNLSYIVRKAENKFGALISICNGIKGSGIIYVRERKTAKKVSSFLQSQHIEADFYHAGLSKEERSVKQDRWKKGDLRIIVATNAFGMGIDKANVRFVCHYQLPESVESYYQEAGRAGRDGKKAYAVLLWNRSDVSRLNQVYRITFPELDYIKDIYQKMFIFLDISYQGGKGETYKFNLLEFVKRFGLDASSAYNSIKYIEGCGYWNVTDEIDNPSRVMFTIDRDDLYRIQLFDNDLDTFVKALMRIYPGLFSHLVSIDESYIADVTKNAPLAVKMRLNELSRQGIVKYIPAARSPLIYFPVERLTPDNLYISSKDYLYRKEMFKKRLDAMYQYIAEPGKFSGMREDNDAGAGCRSERLSAYFGQKSTVKCGQCDLCRQEKNF